LDIFEAAHSRIKANKINSVMVVNDNLDEDYLIKEEKDGPNSKTNPNPATNFTSNSNFFKKDEFYFNNTI
jgi:hypothetical protein